mgnify:CR=1 FL=1
MENFRKGATSRPVLDLKLSLRPEPRYLPNSLVVIPRRTGLSIAESPTTCTIRRSPGYNRKSSLTFLGITTCPLAETTVCAPVFLFLPQCEAERTEGQPFLRGGRKHRGHGLVLCMLWLHCPSIGSGSSGQDLPLHPLYSH